MNIKKIFAIATAACLLATSTTAAFAENGTTAQAPTGTVQQGQQPGGQAPNDQQGQQPNGQTPNGQQGQQPNGQAPNGQQGQQPNGQAPNNQQGQQPNGQTPNGQQGQQPNGQAPNGQQGQQPSGQAPNGQTPMARLSLKTLLSNNVISQETYDAIAAYLKENAPEKPTDNDNAPSGDTTQTPPEKPADDTSAPSDNNAQTPPEKPSDAADNGQNGGNPPAQPMNGEASDMEDSVDSAMLENLLKANIITQEQYDAISKLFTSTENGSTI